MKLQEELSLHMEHHNTATVFLKTNGSRNKWDPYLLCQLREENPLHIQECVCQSALKAIGAHYAAFLAYYIQWSESNII